MRLTNWVLGCLVAAAALALSSSSARADALAEGPLKIRVEPAVPLKVRAFPLEDVRLLDGPFKHAMELDRQYLLSLDVDRLLHTFRVNAGLPSSAKPLGGWEEPKGEAARPFRRALPLGLRADVRQHRRRATQRKGRRRRRRSGRVPGEARQRLPERLSRGVLRPRRDRASASGRPTTRCTRSTPACSTCTSTATTSRPWTCARSSPTGSSPATTSSPTSRCRRCSAPSTAA